MELGAFLETLNEEVFEGCFTISYRPKSAIIYHVSDFSLEVHPHEEDGTMYCRVMYQSCRLVSLQEGKDSMQVEEMLHGITKWKYFEATEN